MRAHATMLAMALVAVGSTAVTGQSSIEPIPEPVAFSARWIASENLGEPDAWGVTGIDPRRGIGGEWEFVVESSSEPRMNGAIVYDFNDDHYRSIDLHLHHSAFRITNEEGAWQETPASLLGHPDLRASTRTAVFVGEGGYDGLVAVAELTWDRTSQAWDVDGYIITGELPAPPGEGSFPE